MVGYSRDRAYPADFVASTFGEALWRRAICWTQGALPNSFIPRRRRPSARNPDQHVPFSGDAQFSYPIAASLKDATSAPHESS